MSGRQPASVCVCGYTYPANAPAEMACPSCGKVRPLLVYAEEKIPVGTHTTAELWKAAAWAASWYTDALDQARLPKGDLNARRREIIFAVCFLESYLYEWAYNKVGPREIDNYLPDTYRRGISDKWKEIPKLLKADGKIPGIPNLGGTDWGSFLKLVNYRDGLTHAIASRPTSPSEPNAPPPVPSPEDLQDMEPGWPVVSSRL